MPVINFCVEVEDFDYVGDGYLERIIKVTAFELDDFFLTI